MLVPPCSPSALEAEAGGLTSSRLALAALWNFSPVLAVSFHVSVSLNTDSDELSNPEG